MSEIDHGQFEAIAFDYDGTLAITQGLHEPARNRAFEIMFETTGDTRFRDVPQEVHAEAHRHGSSPHTIIGWILQQSEIVPADADLYSHPVVEETVRHKDKAYQDIVGAGADVVPGAAEYIDAMYKIMPGQLAIATTARLDIELRPFLRRHCLEDIFPDHRITAREHVASLKPDPEAYTRTIRMFGLEDRPDRLLVYEDTAHGIEAAKRAGAFVAAVPTTHSVEEIEELEGDQHPDIIVPSFAYLAARLQVI